MKFTTILFSAALIAGAAAQTTKTTTTTAPVETNSSYGPEVDACMDKCKPGDTTCLATCLGNPAPTEEQVKETTKCAAACKQGNGSEAETKAYAECQWDCTLKHYLPNPDNVPSVGATQTSTSSGPVATDDDGNPITTTSSNGNSTSTETSATTTPSADGDSAASTMTYSASFAGVVAAFAAFFAL